MRRAAIFVLRATEAVVLASLLLAAATIAAAISLARDEDTHPADCVGPCCDPGADDLEAVARVTGLVVFNAPTLAEGIAAELIDHAVEGETCPDYPHEIVWGAS